jgi:hypothetical protein
VTAIKAELEAAGTKLLAAVEHRASWAVGAAHRRRLAALLDKAMR